MSTEPRPAGVTPPVAVVFAAVTFGALAIGGLGVTSLVVNEDVIAVEGLGAIPGVIGMLTALGLFAAALRWSLRAVPPGFVSAVPCALAAYVGEIVGIAVGAVVSGADTALGLSAASSVALGWPGAVVAGAGLLAGAFGILLVRTPTDRARWSWESDED